MSMATQLASYQAPVADEMVIDILQYAPLVKKMASILIARLPVSIELDDLIQVGIMGLIDAARHFDPRLGVQFETFASPRIRGAMLDELRREDWLPRQVRHQAKQIEEAIAALEQKYGRSPFESEIAQHMGLTLVDYQKLLSDCKGMVLLHFEDFTDEEGEFDTRLPMPADPRILDPLALLSDDAFRRALSEAIKGLPEREGLIMALYYEQELNLKEIGAVLNISESRVSQLHTQAMGRLRVKMREWR